ncbi:lipoprotein [uncultured Microbulbifer sp.]|uniref:lipoprotein n=1 Tax=uncultured Microbulbifer sp. TaxID=348147 RepID=UPI00262DDD0E|nr:lipoprotein [uncultured Microbulbifer sp.]
MNKYLSAIAITLLLSGCAEPLPEKRLHYVGEWQSKEMGLLILADGTVAYKRLKSGSTTSVNGPLKKFVGDDFTVGILFLTTTFHVTEPPHEADGVWTMTVDGVQLTRVSE